MDAPDRHTMQLLVESRPWKRWAVVLYDRFQQIQRHLATEEHQQRLLQGKLQELRYVLGEPYTIAGYRTPFEVVSEAELEQWLGDSRLLKADMDPDTRIAELEATIVRAQAELDALKGAKSPVEPPPWEARRHSSPV